MPITKELLQQKMQDETKVTTQALQQIEMWSAALNTARGKIQIVQELLTKMEAPNELPEKIPQSKTVNSDSCSDTDRLVADSK